jgi:hypothetical protein
MLVRLRLTAQKSLQHTYPQHHATDCRLQPRPRARVSPVFSMLSMSLRSIACEVEKARARYGGMAIATVMCEHMHNI